LKHGRALTCGEHCIFVAVPTKCREEDEGTNPGGLHQIGASRTSDVHEKRHRHMHSFAQPEACAQEYNPDHQVARNLFNPAKRYEEEVSANHVDEDEGQHNDEHRANGISVDAAERVIHTIQCTVAARCQKTPPLSPSGM